jgi:hypothetical protein
LVKERVTSLTAPRPIILAFEDAFSCEGWIFGALQLERRRYATCSYYV